MHLQKRMNLATYTVCNWQNVAHITIKQKFIFLFTLSLPLSQSVTCNRFTLLVLSIFMQLPKKAYNASNFNEKFSRAQKNSNVLG